MTSEPALSRRDFISAAALGVAAIAAPRHGGAAPQSRDARRLMYVGTYTDDHRSAGIYMVRMEPATGVLHLVGAAASTANPSFLVPARGGRFVYAVNETEQFEGKPTGAVSAFRSDGAAGALSFVDQKPSSGGAPCYVTTDRTGRHLLVANYVGGSVTVLPVRADGGVGDATATVQHEGKGAKPDRQSGPHAHCIIPDPANRFVLVADLGLDQVLTYRFDASAGTLAAVSHATLAPGAGPRHLAFHPNGRVVYVVNELDSTVTTFGYDAASGRLTARQTVPSIGEHATGENAPADVHVHRSGRYLYMSNRGHDTIAVFAIDPAKSTLTQVEQVPTGGKWPRNFALDPSGRFLYVANQRSDSIVGFRVAAATGRLTPTGQSLELPVPVCLRFVG